MNNTDVIILSILIPSIPERSRMLKAVVETLQSQINDMSPHTELGEVEVIVNDSKSFLKGGITVGEKRGRLVHKAKGKYLCFLDDDDTIAPNYIETLLRMCNEDKDVCTFRTIIKLADYWGLVDMKFIYKVNDQATPDYTIRRPPWHICPVRSEFAKLYKFEKKNNAEDFEWFEKVLAHCVNEAHTEKILFQYNHGINSEVDKIDKKNALTKRRGKNNT